jgi:predicted aldo/keto reductase-like oxidoreductase
MNRRQFIQNSLSTGAALSATVWLGGRSDALSQTAVFPKRVLGKTGEKLSIIGFGGIVVRDETPESSANLVAWAVDHGINYFDVAPTYGNAQDRLGPALKPYRKNCFLACKTTQRRKEEADKELHESLRKLETDHFDLYQLHALSSMEDTERAFGPHGAMEAVVKARQDGKIRFIGFSAHSEEGALLAMEQFDFDTILMPINFVCWMKGQFGPRAVAKAKEKGMGILALKAMAHTRLDRSRPNPYPKMWYTPIEDESLVHLSLRFTLSQGTTAAIPPGYGDWLKKAVRLMADDRPLTAEENGILVKAAQEVEPLFALV